MIDRKFIGMALPEFSAQVDAPSAPQNAPTAAINPSAMARSPCGFMVSTCWQNPLVRVFRGSLQASHVVDVVHHDQSPLLVEQMTYTQETGDVIEHRLYQPATRLAARIGDLARTVQNGSIHRYVGFSFAALVLVLVVVAL